MVLLAMAMTLCAAASFAMVRDVSFEEMTELSDTTMEVVVVNSYAEWNDEHTAIFTHYVVEPMRQVGGRSRGSRFELLFAGGIASDGRQMIVTEVPSLEVGGHYILFLHPRETRHASPTVGMWQGALRVVRHPETAKPVLVDGGGNLIEKNGAGRLYRGRNVEVNAEGFVTFRAEEAEPGMESDPVLRDPEGRVVPMPRSQSPEMIREAGEPVDPDTLMNFVANFRQSRGPRVNQ